MAQSDHIKGLSNLILAIHDKQERAQRLAANRQTTKMKGDLYEKSREGITQRYNEMKMIEVTSNYARDRVVMLDNGRLVLHFDHEGLAQMPEHLLPVLKREMRARPGRYKVVEEAVEEVSEDAVRDDAAVELESRVDEMLSKLEEEILIEVDMDESDDEDEDESADDENPEEPVMEDE